jgi:hypothetical protein
MEATGKPWVSDGPWLQRRLAAVTGLLGAASLVGGLAAAGACCAAPTVYPMAEDAWTMQPPMLSMGDEAAQASFRRYESMPMGTMTLNQGVAAAKAAQFTTGTIDFDMKPLGYDDAGVVFHRRGDTDGEFVYLRANPDCPAANDCIQYAPITHTMMAWNIYPNYQASAPISPASWNHVHIEVVADGMRVYVNHSAEPSLVVPRLYGLTRDGGLAFKGPAIFANLVLDRQARSSLQAIQPALVESGAVTAWLAAPPTVYNRERPVLAGDRPASATFRSIEVEPTGLVNLGRAFGLGRAPSPSLVWLKTTVTVDAATRRVLRLGFAEEVSVFFDGDRIYSGENQYFPYKGRLSIDGRLALDNATITLNLHKGPNEIYLAVANDWLSHSGHREPSPYGWGVQAHIDPAVGTRE